MERGWRLTRVIGAIFAALVTMSVVTVSTALATLISVGDINVQSLADALTRAPVQLGGRPDPTLSGAALRSLRSRIAHKDSGRIRIAIVTPLSVRATGDLSQALSDAINTDGVVIVVSGSNYHVTTTWGSGDAARNRLAAAVDRPNDSLAVQMRRAIDSFARADAAAGQPGSNSSEQNGSTTTPGQTSAPTHGSGGGGGGDAGLIAALVAIVIVVLVVGIPGARVLRRSMRASHWRREESADVHAEAQADFIKLGEDIGALDIDSSMPNANTEARDEYSNAIDCYQDAERRLRTPDDSYQFARAQDALQRGRQHLQNAERLFNASADPAMGTASSADPVSGSPGLDGRLVDRLAALAALHERGELTDAEFNEQKRRLLAQ